MRTCSSGAEVSSDAMYVITLGSGREYFVSVLSKQLFYLVAFRNFSVTRLRNVLDSRSYYVIQVSLLN